MSSYINFISKKYDKEIRECCDDKKINLEKCIKSSKNVETSCNLEIRNFKTCIMNFSNDFKKKYSFISNFEIYY